MHRDEEWPTLAATRESPRSEEHTSELQSHLNLVCRLLLEKKITRLSQQQFGDEKSNNRGQKSLEQQAEPRILYPVKLSIKNTENILEFSGKTKL